MNLKFHVEQIFRQIFGRDPLKVEYILQGVMNAKYKVSYPGENYLIRFYLINGAEKIKSEPGLMQRFYRAGAKVPEVVFVSSDHVNYYGEEIPFIIYKWVDGKSLSFYLNNKIELNIDQALNQINNNLSIISAIELNGFGEIKSSYQANFPSFQKFLFETIESEFPFVKENNKFAFVNKNELRTFLMSYASMVNEKTKPNFIWTDISFDNIIMDNGNLEAFIDFEHSISGDKTMTIGYFFSRYGNSPIFDKFLKIYYQAKLPNSLEETLIFYSLFRLLRIVRYLKTDLPSGKKRDDIFDVFPGIRKSLNHFRL